jgi:hypothetical protein
MLRPEFSVFSSKLRKTNEPLKKRNKKRDSTAQKGCKSFDSKADNNIDSVGFMQVAARTWK